MWFHVPQYLIFIPYLITCTVLIGGVTVVVWLLSCIRHCLGWKIDTEAQTFGFTAFTSFGYCSTWIRGKTRAFVYYTAVFLIIYNMLYPRNLFYAFWQALHIPSADERIFFDIVPAVFASLMVVALMTIVYLLVGYAYARYPDKDHGFVNDKNFLARIGVIIPCHKSEDEIGKTIRSILVHIPPANVVVVDNSNDETPPDQTEARVKEENASIKYLYIPQGLKTRAMWEGMRMLPESVEYIIHVDDDTILPRNMVFDESHFDDPMVSGVSYGISMINREQDESKEPDPDPNLVQQFVDREFMLFSQWRYFRALSSTSWFCHGIIGLWKRKRFEKIMEEHPFLPFGEDGWIGCMNLLKGHKLRQELRCFVSTFAPSQLLPSCVCGWGGREQGYGASSLWKQRAHRWYVNAPRRLLHRAHLFLVYDAGSFFGNIFFRVEVLKHIAQVVLHLLLPVLLAKAFVNFEFLFFFNLRLAFYFIELIQHLIINYVLWSHRPDIQHSLLVVLLYPLYTDFLQICTVFGAYKCLLYYAAWVNMRMGIFTIDANKVTIGSLLTAGKNRPILISDEPTRRWRSFMVFALVLHGLVIWLASIAMPYVAVFDSIGLGIGIYAIKSVDVFHLWQIILYMCWSFLSAAFSFFLWYLEWRDGSGAQVDLLPEWWPGVGWRYEPGTLYYYNYFFVLKVSPFVRCLSFIAAVLLMSSIRRFIEHGPKVKSNQDGYSQLADGERSQEDAKQARETKEGTGGNRSNHGSAQKMMIAIGEEDPDPECVHDPEKETPWGAMS